MIFKIIISYKEVMAEKKEIKKENEERYIKNLVKLGKMISIEASKNPKLEEKIKRLSSY